MSQIQISDLTFSYEGSYDNIFENVSFQLDTDWKLGFIGRNGRGKTTLLRLLSGNYEYRGSIRASVDFDYFPFEVKDPSADTIDAARGIADFEDWQLLRELNALDVSEEILYRPFETLSHGERTKVLLALLFLRPNSFLLIDEPTNHLDAEARKTVGEYLNTKKGFILVSHDRAFLDSCVDHILSLNRLGLEVQKGNFSSWQQNKDRQDNYERAENEILKKDIRKLEAAAKRTEKWSDKAEKTKLGTNTPDSGFIGHKAAKMMKRSKTIEARQQSAIKEKSGLLRNVEISEDLKINPLEYHKNTLLELRDVTVSYSGRAVCAPVTFSVMNGDRIALCGKNGSGKSSILKLILGTELPENLSYGGSLSFGGGLKISYVSQDTSGLSGDLKQFCIDYSIDESLFKAILRKMDFSRLQFEKNIEGFSAGQKKKVLIARSLCEQAHLYIWDEPLNFIDVLSRIQIEELILKHKPTMLFVEHDAVFAGNVATKKINLA